MATRQSPPMDFTFTRRRYWYHISTTLRHPKRFLKPLSNSEGFNRNDAESRIDRTCVAPSVEQCLTAVPYYPAERYVIYRTEKRVRAVKPPREDVFDANVTQEGWLVEPAMFVKIGTLSLEDVEQGENRVVVKQSASSSDPRHAGRVLRWWKRRHLKQYIKQT